MRNLIRSSRFEASYVNLKFLVAAVGLGSSLAAFHFAGSSAYGSFVASMAICSLGSAGAGGWVGQGMLRYQEMSRVPLLRVLGRSPRRWSLFVAPVFVSGLAGAVPIWAASEVTVLAAMLALTVTLLLALQSIQVSRSMVARRAGLAGLAEGSRVLALSGSVVIEPWARSVGLGPLIGPLLLCSVLLLATNISLTIRLPARDQRGGSTRAAQLVIYGGPLALWIVLGGLYQNLDRVLLERMASASEAGHYALIYDVANRGLLLPLTALAASLHVRVLGQYDGSDPARGRTTNARIMALQRRVSVAAVPIGLLTVTILVHTIPSFTPELGATAILVFAAGLVWADAVNVQREIQGSGRTGSLLVVLGWSVLVNLCLTVALIPWFRGVGAAIATLVSAVLYDFLVVRRVRVGRSFGAE